MSISSKRAVEVLCMAVTFNGCGRSTSDELKEAVRAAVAALQEKAEREDPKPLTLEELRQMDGELVYLKVIDKSDRQNPHRSEWSEVFLWNQNINFWRFGNECEIEPKPENYGKTWVCYRHKPKEGQNAEM